MQLYPERLSNTEHDEWVSRVYGYKNTFLHTGVQVRDKPPRGPSNSPLAYRSLHLGAVGMQVLNKCMSLL